MSGWGVLTVHPPSGLSGDAKDKAIEAIAEAEMARAESEAMAKKERAVERAMEEGRI